MIRNRIWKFYGIKETEHGDFVYLNSISAFSQNFKTFVMRILMILKQASLKVENVFVERYSMCGKRKRGSLILTNEKYHWAFKRLLMLVT